MSSDSDADVAGNSNSNEVAVDNPSEGAKEETSNTKKKERCWERGSQMNPHKRAKQFDGDFEVRGDALWCIACACPVGWKEKSTASKHRISQTHKDSVKRASSLVHDPGSSVDVVGPPVSITNGMVLM